MDFMKVLDQTVREIKREVNLKVLKVPEIEQKVLDATDNEAWGPHGSALSEIAQATKKFTECQLVMNVLWTRLGDTGRDWRHVYKALAVIEYLVANGSERAVDDIIEHTFQISSLSGFEYVEPSGKDVGLNVRKKAEMVVALLNNKDKIQEVRNKAAANRDKYFGLSSSGVTYKSSSASYGSSSYGNSDRYGGFTGAREVETFKDSYKDTDPHGEERYEKDTSAKSRRGFASENQESTSKKGPTSFGSKEHEAFKPSKTVNDPDKYVKISSESASVSSVPQADDFDDFDPRGTSNAKTDDQVDLFGQSSLIDLMDAPTPVSIETTVLNTSSSDADLFADAAFVSASPHEETGGSSQAQTNVDLFASQPAFPSTNSSDVDFFAAANPVVHSETKHPKSDQINVDTFDPFAAVPLNNFEGSDLFGAFTSHTDSVSTEPMPDPVNNLSGKSTESNPTPKKKNTFQVKSGIWADSLSRGIIDLNISAPKKVSLTDIGIVGGLTDGSDEKEKGPIPSTYYKGQAMGMGSGLGRTGVAASTSMGVDDFFTSLGSQQEYQFGSFQK